MAIYFYIQVVKKGNVVSHQASYGDIIIHGGFDLYETERYFGKSTTEICNYYKPYHLMPMDKVWILSFGNAKTNKVELDLHIPPFYWHQYVNHYKKGKSSDLPDFLKEICENSKELIGNYVELDFEAFDYYLHQDNA